MSLIESIFKIFAKVLLLVLGWPIGVVIIKLGTLGRATRLFEVDSDEEELSSAYWILHRNSAGELKYTDITAAWLGAALLIIALWAWNDFPLPW